MGPPLFNPEAEESSLNKNFTVPSENCGWWSGLKSSRLTLTIYPSQVRREVRGSPRYLELYIVADHTLVSRETSEV